MAKTNENTKPVDTTKLTVTPARIRRLLSKMDQFGPRVQIGLSMSVISKREALNLRAAGIVALEPDTFQRSRYVRGNSRVTGGHRVETVRIYWVTLTPAGREYTDTLAKAPLKRAAAAAKKVRAANARASKPTAKTTTVSGAAVLVTKPKDAPRVELAATAKRYTAVERGDNWYVVDAMGGSRFTGSNARYAKRAARNANRAEGRATR